MALEDPCAAANALLKLQRATPFSPAEEDLPVFLALAELVIRINSLLPGHAAAGLGDAQRDTVAFAVEALRPTVVAALQRPLRSLTPALLDLLRSLARGSAADAREREFQPTGQPMPRDFRIHRHASYEMLKSFGDGLARAELAYDVNLEGARVFKNLATPEYWEAFNTESLDRVQLCNTMWAMPILFDGLRMRHGIDAVAQLARDTEDTEDPWVRGSAGLILGAGETSLDRERVGRAVQLFLAAASQAARELDHPNDAILRCLEADLRLGLERCRVENEHRCLVPGKSMRVILDVVSGEMDAASACFERRSLFQLAFLFPCIVPQNLADLDGYDGGLLSVWDACLHLIRLNSKTTHTILPIQTALSAVLGGAVGNLVSDRVTGPFVVHPHCVVKQGIDRINDSWPTSKAPTHAVAPSTSRGKMVGTTVAICDALQRRVFKGELRTSPAAAARADAALTMRVLGRPTDGIMPLKRLYLTALHFEPGTPTGRSVTRSDTRLPPAPTSPFVDGLPGHQAGMLPLESVEMVWREVVGGAAVTSGPLFCFSRQAFAETLVQDWLPKEAVATAVREQTRSVPVMLPAEAMKLLAKRAHEHVAKVVTDVDNFVQTCEGPAIVTRAMETLNAYANSVYPHSAINPLWESCIMHFCCPPTIKKRHRLGA